MQPPHTYGCRRGTTRSTCACHSCPASAPPSPLLACSARPGSCTADTRRTAGARVPARVRGCCTARVRAVGKKQVVYHLSIRKAPSTLHPSIRLLDFNTLFKNKIFISRSCSAVVLVSVVMWQVSPHAVSNRSNSRLSTCSSSVAKSVAGALTDAHGGRVWQIRRPGHLGERAARL